MGSMKDFMERILVSKWQALKYFKGLSSENIVFRISFFLFFPMFKGHFYLISYKLCA